MEIEVGTVEVDGMRVGYRRAGAGSPLVLLHGAVSDGRVWRETIEALAGEYEVVAWDAPGCGRSTDPPEPYSLEAYADAVAGLAAGLDLDHAHLVGHSFGAGLALQVYGRHPDLVDSLTLIGGYAGWAGSLPPEEVDGRLQHALALAEDLPDRWTPETMPGLFSDRITPETADELLAIMSDTRPTGVRAIAHAFAAADLRPVLPTIAVRTLLVHGDADVRSPLAVARALHDAIPGSRLVVLPGLGHELAHEEPERFVTEVRAFLRTVD